MMERFLSSMDDIREEQEALLERELDPDMALASDYVTGALPEQDAAAVRARIQNDPAFADLIEPLVVAYEHGRRPPALSAEDRRRKYLELRRRIGLPGGAAGPDEQAAAFGRELDLERRRTRRRVAYMFAAILLLAVIPAAVYEGVKWFHSGGLYDRAPWGVTQVVPLMGGASATLSSGTRLVKLGDFGTASRRVVLTGEATFDVPPGSGLPPLVVGTESAEVTVTGTRFTVHAYEWEPTEIRVERGSVRVRGRDAGGAMLDSAVTLSAGQRARAVRGGHPEVLP